MNFRKYIKYLLGLYLISSSLSISAQMIERPAMAVKGKYDVKMISGLGLQLAWVSAVNPYTIFRPVTDEEMNLCSYRLGMNNYTSGAANSFYSPLYGGYVAFKPAEALGVAMVYADCDDDMSTFQSSAALLDFESAGACSQIEKAYLYWTGMIDSTALNTCNYASYPGIPTLKSHMGGAIGTSGGINAYKTIKIKAPGASSYTNVTASRYIQIAGADRYICFADVTPQIQGYGNGLYWVANIRSSSFKANGGATSGWSLVVVYKNNACPPRSIKFWDGQVDISSGTFTNINFNLGVGDVPAVGETKSYLGMGILDGENLASYLSNNMYTPEYLEVTSSPGGTMYKINPFTTGQTHMAGEEQPPVPVYDDNGMYLGKAYDGFSCSRISSWSDASGKNGNPIVRIPAQANTLGYDAHHLKLPTNAIVASATTVNVKCYAGSQGGTSPYFAYMAIEAAQPKLRLSMRTEGTSVTTPNAEISYVLRVENTGALALPTGAYIIDTLDIPVDFKIGSVEYLRGTASQAPEIFSQGADANEIVKLYLPAIIAGDGINATDSVVIRFKVKVKDSSRADIWNLNCHHFIRNRAIAYYQDAALNNYEAWSNQDGECPSNYQYEEVYVDDPAIDQMLNATHQVTENIYAKMLTAIQNSSVLRVDSLLRESLGVQLLAVGLSPATKTLYTIYDEAYNAVSPNAVFSLAENKYIFYAKRMLDSGCEEVFTFTFTIEPQISNLQIEKPSCIGFKEGKISFIVSNGVPRYSCKLVDMMNQNQILYQAAAPTNNASVTFQIDGLAAGAYKLIVGDQNPMPSVTDIIIEEPEILGINILSPDTMCVGMDVTLLAEPTGRDGAVDLDYAWQKSSDNSTWIDVSGNSSNQTATITEDTYFQVFVCDNSCVTSATKKVSVDTTPGCIPVELTESTTTSTLVYPNPTKTGFYIRSGLDDNTVKVFDLQGQLLRTSQVADGSFINIESLPQGNYVVDVNGVLVKLIKQ